MKKEMVVALLLLVLFAFAGMARSEKIHPPATIGELHFEEDSNGDQIAVSKDNPSVFYQFTHPVLCLPFGNPKDISDCRPPSVFLDHGGKVKSWNKSIVRNLSGYGMRENPMVPAGTQHPISYYVVETPKYVYYCIYEDGDASRCQLFPDNDLDIKIKVGDRFAACSDDPESWARDKNGVLYDCTVPFFSSFEKAWKYIGREAEFIVDNIASNGEIFLRCVNRYTPFGNVSPVPLDQNNRLDMMGTMSGQPNIFIMVKLKEAPKAKAKTSKSKKK